MKKIYRVALSILFLLSLSFSMLAQNSFFTPKNEAAISLINSKRVIIPNKYNTVQADINQLKNFLWSLPSEKNVSNRNTAPILELPMPDGSMAKFHVWESSLMEPGLEAKFPEMKTFAGQGITDRYATIRFDYNPYSGFHAQVLSAVTGAFYVDPYARGNINNYISYFKRDNVRYAPFECYTADNPSLPSNIVAAGPCRGTELYTYRLALACTGEYAVAVCLPNPPTIAATAAAMLTTVNRVSGVYETEVSLRMVLIANNNLLIYLDGATDPYTNNNGVTMLGQNQTNIDNVIGTANYDIGHVVSTGGGGVANLQVPCVAGQKARGVTGLTNPVGDNFDIDYVAHEMGHQWGGNHSFNGITSNCSGGNRNGSTAYEVGSGTSIQCYAGICGADNLQPHSDPFFHSISFDEISNYISTGNGFNCKVATNTGNTLPVITAMNNNGANIPLSTPFTLTGAATDNNNDPLTYCWEEWDLGPATLWNNGNINTTSPLFKSRVPKTSGSRTFPDISLIAANYVLTAADNNGTVMGGNKGETLPTQARALKFRLTVRDNRAGGGGVVTGGDGCQAGFTGIFQINTIVGTGPFVVTIPNGGESYAGGSTQTVTWNTAGSDVAPISCANVKISLSTDGGLTYPTVILASTPNDGTQSVTIPGIATTTARIKVEAVGNVFFDISNANFNITTTPASSSDLAISKTDGVATYTPGGTTTYTIVASNAGPDASVGATVTDNFPAAITSVAWTAVYAGGATGPANGAGNISATVNLPVGGTATFTAVCNISGAASGNLVNTATVAVPAGDTDPTPGNNSATDTDTQAGATCSWTTSTVYPIPVLDQAVAVVGTNLYSFAGVSNGAVVSTSFKFDGTTWTSILAYPIGVEYPASASDGTNIFIVGGALTGTGVPQTTVYRYNVALNTYTLMAPCNIATWNPVSVYLNGKIYKFGGTTAVATVSSNALEIYDIATNTWSAGANMPAPASFMGGFSDGVFIYACGGLDAATSAGSLKTYRYNIATNTWDDAAIADLPATRWGPAYGFFNGNGILAGGYVGGSAAANISATAISWSPTTNTWTPLANMPADRSRVNGGYLCGSYYAVGGRSQASPAFVGTNTTYKYTCTPGLTSDLAISKTDGITIYTPGGTTTYTIVASNSGTDAVFGAIVADNFPAAITSVAWTAVYAGGASGPAAGAGNINATVNIPVGGTATFTAVCNISGAASGNLVNTATVTAPCGVTDPTPGNNSATDTDVQTTPNVTVTATAGTPGPTPYATVKTAFDAINAGTHQGAIIVNVNASTDEGATPAVLNSSGTGSASYTSVLMRPTADGLSVVGSATPASRGVIELNGADNVTIDGDNPNTAGTNRNLTLSLITVNASVLIWLKTPGAADGCLGNTIKNCNLNGQGTYTTIAGVIAGSNTFGGAALAPNSNNTMQNNAVIRLQNGLFQSGFATTPYDVNWQVKDNIMGSSVLADKLGFRGMILINASGYLVNNNTIMGINSSTTTTSTMTGIQLGTGNLNGTISNNRISDIKHNNTAGWGSNGIWLNGGDLVSNTNVYNNMISDVASVGFNGVAFSDNGYGMVISSGGGYNVYYNTIVMNTNQTSATGLPAAINVTNAITTANTLNIRDNLIVNTQTIGTQRYAVYSGAAASVYADINYNDYWFTGPNLGNIGGTLRANLAAWQTGTGKDANSVSVAPVFVSATDFHLVANSNCGINAKGTPITVPAITTDIDGDTRNVTTPDIGADEFNGNNPSATIAYSGSPYCTNAGTATATQTGTTGGTYSSTAGLTINPATGDVTLATSTPGTYTVTYTIAAAGSCATFTTTATITVVTCVNTCVEDFDAVVVPALPAGWTATVGATCVNTARWATVNTTSSSAPNSAFVNDPNCISDEYLDSKIYAIGAAAQQLVFRNNYNLEASTVTPTVGFDGMVLEISINGGGFVDIITAGGSFVTGGYNRTISGGFSSPIANRNAWSGNSGGFITTTVNLPAAALGQNVVFRFRRATDSSVGAVGANIDDVYVIAAATISYAGSPYCSNAGTATVTRTGAAGGTYSSTAGLTINAATGDVTLGTSTPGTYTVTYTIASSGGCPAFTTTTTITITAAAAATIAYTGSPYCQNAGTATVTRTGTAGGTYSSTAGLTINAATGAVTLGTSTPGTYTVTYTIAAGGGCGTFTTTTTITITATPAATISYAGSPYCSSDLTAPVTRTGTAGGTYSSTAGLTINAATGTVTPNTSTPGTYTVTYSIPAGGGCAAFSTTTTITITQAPNAIIFYAGTPYCQNGGTATVTRTGTAGGTYSAAPAGLTLNATTGAVTLGTSTPGTYTVTYTIAASGGCGITITTTTITINAAPAATIAYTGSPYCSNAGTANVTRTGTAGGTYSSTAGLTINAATGAVTLGTSTPGTYTVTYTIAASGGCATFTTTATITITALPAATIAYAGSPYCQNAGTATVTRTGTAGGTYSSTAGLSINAATGDVNLAASTAGTYTVTYTIAAGGGCPVVTATTTITITTLPAATISYAGNPYCQNAGTATVTRTGTAGGTYSSTAGLTINAATGAVTLGTSTPGTYTVTYTLAAGGGCPAVTATTTITVNSLSVAPTAATASPAILCGPATVTLSVTGGSLGTGATWRWYSGSCGGTVVGTGATLNVTVSATTLYFVRAEGTCNTTACASVLVTVNAQPTITIAASPSTTLTPFMTTTLTATVTPADPTNTTVWYRNGVVVPGATGLTLVVNIDGLGLYTARTTTTAGCTALSNAVDITGTFVNKLFITPNPNNGQFKVRYYSGAQQLGFVRHLVMIAENGQRVFDETYPITAPYSSMNVDARRLPKGIYIVMLTDAFGKEVLATGKVVLQ